MSKMLDFEKPFINHKQVSTMQSEISYRFERAQLANRFLNELKHWTVADVKAKLFNASDAVKITYEFDGKGFDYTCSELDDLAAKYGGEEI
jgi:hypothetical protein